MTKCYYHIQNANSDFTKLKFFAFFLLNILMIRIFFHIFAPCFKNGTKLQIKNQNTKQL